MIVGKAQIRYIIYTALGALILYGDKVFAQGAPHNTEFNLDFWFRAALSGLLGALIWIAKGSDTRLKAAENRIREFDKINAQRTEKIVYHDKRLTNLEHDSKEQKTSMGLLRELILTKYHDKEDTDKHREYIESTLSQISTRIERIERRMRIEQGHDDSRR